MFKSNKTYNVFVKSGDKTNLESALFVKEGFNLWAFVFNIIWVLYQRLWALAGILVLFFATLYALKASGYINLITFVIIRNGCVAWLAFDIADWKCADLTKKGYVLYDIIVAESEELAQTRFFDRHLDKASL